MSSKQKTIALIKCSAAANPAVTNLIIQAILNGTAQPNAVIDPVVRNANADQNKPAKQIVASLAIDDAVSVRLPRPVAEEFYAEHAGRPYFEGLVESVTSGNVIALVLSGDNAIADWRTLLGTTNPVEARKKGETSIRALYGTENPHNAGHGSDSEESFKREHGILAQFLNA